MADTNLQLDISCHQVKPSVPNVMSSSNPSPQSSEYYVKEEAERLEKPEGMDGLHQGSSIFQTLQDSHRQTKTAVACPGPAQVRASWGPNTEREIGYFLPSLTNKLSPTDTYLKSKN